MLPPMPLKLAYLAFEARLPRQERGKSVADIPRCTKYGTCSIRGRGALGRGASRATRSRIYPRPILRDVDWRSRDARTEYAKHTVDKRHGKN